MSQLQRQNHPFSSRHLLSVPVTVQDLLQRLHYGAKVRKTVHATHSVVFTFLAIHRIAVVLIPAGAAGPLVGTMWRHDQAVVD